jgi:hypothetical protein
MTGGFSKEGTEKSRGSHKTVSKERLTQAIRFFTARVEQVRQIKSSFVTFTEQTLKEVETATQQAPRAANINVLWHDFLFIFFQYFIGGCSLS